MSIDKITFENNDTDVQKAIKTCLLYAGSSELKKELNKLKIEYVKIQKGGIVKYILKGKNIGKITVKL